MEPTRLWMIWGTTYDVVMLPQLIPRLCKLRLFFHVHLRLVTAVGILPLSIIKYAVLGERFKERGSPPLWEIFDNFRSLRCKMVLSLGNFWSWSCMGGNEMKEEIMVSQRRIRCQKTSRRPPYVSLLPSILGESVTHALEARRNFEDNFIFMTKPAFRIYIETLWIVKQTYIPLKKPVFSLVIH